MNTIIKVSIKNVYGNTLIYPANDTGRIIAGLMGKKTFTRGELSTLEHSLGYTIEVETPVLT